MLKESLLQLAAWLRFLLTFRLYETHLLIHVLRPWESFGGLPPNSFRLAASGDSGAGIPLETW